MELPEVEDSLLSGTDSQSQELELVSQQSLQNQTDRQNFVAPKPSTENGDCATKSGLFKTRIMQTNKQPRFTVNAHSLPATSYHVYPNSSAQFMGPSLIEQEMEKRKQPKPTAAFPPATLFNGLAKYTHPPNQRESTRCIQMPMPTEAPVPPPSQRSIQQLPKLPLKFERKKEKTRLKNLEKYKNIEISSQPQNLDKLRERAAELKLEREYGNLLRRQKGGESTKFTDQEIKIWLKKDNRLAPVEKQLALSFINTHVNNYAPLLKIILTHSFADDLIEPECKKIPTTFPDKETYQKVFEFLIFNETIAALHSSYENYSKSDSCQKPVRSMIKPGGLNEDGFFTFWVKECNENSDEPPQHTIRNLSLSKFNLIIVSSSPLFDAESYSLKDFDRGFLFMGCVLTPQNKEQLAADSKIITAINEPAFLKSKGNGWTSAYIFTFEKTSTFVREFLAVRNVQFMDLAEFIYNPPLMTRSDPTYISKAEVFDGFFGKMEPIYNKTQLRSIKELCLRDRGIIMLQGPPGTGKTSTLLGVLAGQYHYLSTLGQLATTKILVCTPSNTAIDHIVKRVVAEGLISAKGQPIKPRVLRTGLVDTNNQVVRSVYLDYLCQKELLQQNKQLAEQVKWTIPQIKDRITDTLKDIRRTQLALNRCSEPDRAMQDKLKKLLVTKRDLQDRAYHLRKKRIDDKSRYNQIQKRLVSEAEIIFTTLSSAGSERLEKYKGQFACLIVDEAGQCTEPNLLIALQLNIPKVLLIGDPCQLPATTFSPDSNITLFNRSMFERMIDGGLRPYFLDIQYRMAPQIRYFPSKCFYNGRLTDDYSVRSRQYPHEIRNFSQSNLMFVDVRYGSQRKIDKSYENEAEINATRMLVEMLRAHKLSIGVITPYKQQMRRLQQSLKQFGNVFTNTIDSFQGQEKDIILISCVRASKRCSQKSLGFLIDERRINVALTRSKFLLVVIGNADTLGSNEIWDSFLKHVTKQKQYMRLNHQQEARAGLKRLVHGQLTQQDQVCERAQHQRLTRDLRKGERDEIDLGDFVQDVPVSLPVEDGKVKQTSHAQPISYEPVNATPAAQADTPVDKWSVEAAGAKDIQRTLHTLYGDKPFFELLREMK